MDSKNPTAIALMALQYVEELSYKRKASLIAEVGDPGALSANRAAVKKHLGDDNADAFFKNIERVDSIFSELEKRGVHWLTYLDDEYPDSLREIADPPHILFAMGNVAALKNDIIAVVGTRTPTRYGVKIAEEFTKEFANAGLTVVSGFARGIDSIAHRACIVSGNPTIAVFGCGLDICYPAEHKSLLDSVIECGGLIVSEYALGTKPLQYHFPERNRIISGLSRAVFLAEAAKKSGSLITIRLAIEQGKDIFVVPGNIYAAESEGANLLLREMPHALVISPDDVLDAMHIVREVQVTDTVELTIAENQVLEALHDGELHFEELLEKTGLNVSDLTNALFNLDINGLVQNTGGNYYSLA